MIHKLRNILSQFGLEWFNRYYSRYRAEVVDNEDPEFRGRLMIKVPQIFGENIPKYWALPVGMFSGKQIGLFAIPSVGDSVWVSFENGDPRYPLWEYGWFKQDEVPEEAKVDGNKIKNIVLKSLGGHIMEFDDHNEIIRFKTTSEHLIELDDKNKKIKIKSTGNNSVEFDDENELIKVEDQHGNQVILNSTGASIVSGKISLGSLDGSAEPAVLADTAMNLLKEFKDDLGALTTIVTSTGVTSTISTAANWAAFNSKWNTEWEEFKSLKVSLDKN